jgi:indolepyruvate decarboxylase
MEKCVIDEGHPQFAGMYAGAVSDPKTRQIVEGADLVLDLGGVSLNDITTASYSAQLDPSRFITVGLNDVRLGDEVIAGVRLADVLVELAKLKPPSALHRGTRQRLAPVIGSPSDKITMAALYPRYAAFLRCRSGAANDSHYRRRLASANGERNRRHGTVPEQRHRFCSQ